MTEACRRSGISKTPARNAYQADAAFRREWDETGYLGKRSLRPVIPDDPTPDELAAIERRKAEVKAESIAKRMAGYGHDNYEGSPLSMRAGSARGVSMWRISRRTP